MAKTLAQAITSFHFYFILFLSHLYMDSRAVFLQTPDVALIQCIDYSRVWCSVFALT